MKTFFTMLSLEAIVKCICHILLADEAGITLRYCLGGHPNHWLVIINPAMISISVISWIWITFLNIQKEVSEEMKIEDFVSDLNHWRIISRFHFQLKINNEAFHRIPILGSIWDPKSSWCGKEKCYPFFVYYFMVNWGVTSQIKAEIMQYDRD